MRRCFDEKPIGQMILALPPYAEFQFSRGFDLIRNGILEGTESFSCTVVPSFRS